MAGFGNKVKTAVLKGMEAVGQSASNLATNAQQKLQELNLETQRREILSDFPLRAYDLWQKGEAMPEPLAKMLSELNDLDERLSVLRAQRYTHVDIPDEKQDAEGAGEAADENAEADASSEAAESGSGEGNDASVAQGASDEAPVSDEEQAEPVLYVEEHPDAPMDEGETGDNA